MRAWIAVLLTNDAGRHLAGRKPDILTFLPIRFRRTSTSLSRSAMAMMRSRRRSKGTGGRLLSVGVFGGRLRR